MTCAVLVFGCSGEGPISLGSPPTTLTATDPDECTPPELRPVRPGGDVVDLAQLSSGENYTSFDPAVVHTLDESQITGALFDGLFEFDFSTACDPVLRPLVAETFVANADSSTFVFKIRPNVKFANGEPVLPSSFKRAWERAGSKAMESPYQYLFASIKGGTALADGQTSTLPAVIADDAALLLTVPLAAPNVDFPAITSAPAFSPISDADLKRVPRSTGWGSEGAVIGNGPFSLKKADQPGGQAQRRQVVLVRNDRWAGNFRGTSTANLDSITFEISADADVAFERFESGDGDTSKIPLDRFADATEEYQNTALTPLLGSYFFDFGFDDEAVAGPENRALRQAISLSIDREAINAEVFLGSRTASTGITPPGIPGAADDLCEFCVFDAERAQQLFLQWEEEGGRLDRPIHLQFPSGGNDAAVVALIVEQIRTVLGVEVEPTPVEDDYFATVGKKSGCGMCRAGWYADYPAYSNFTTDLFSAGSVGGNNISRTDDKNLQATFAQAQRETDLTVRARLFREAEARILNDLTLVVPINWYTGDQVFRDNVVNFEQSPLGLISWERVGFATATKSDTTVPGSTSEAAETSTSVVK